MTDSFIEYRKAQNIRPLELPNKNKFFYDLTNIENSWTGRIDTFNYCNTFIMEAEQQLVNAIELFENGYFDCAYYSLRSSIEVSTTMIFLSDLPHEDRDKYFSDWKEIKDFPMQGRMLGILSNQGNVFSDMKEKMSSFFTDTKKLSHSLNKYVHKQGFRHFYVSRNHSINSAKSQKNFINNFEYYLRQCIGIVAVMRLAIDPFPVLLMDEEILYRCFDSMTEPYSENFINEYIGMNVIDDYKKTELYIGNYNYFINEPKKNIHTFELIKFKAINTSYINEIMKQISLVSQYDAISFLLVANSEKIVKVHCFDGLETYITDRKSLRNHFEFNTLDFNHFKTSKTLINNKYDEAYISVFNICSETYFAEHNEELTVEEYKTIYDMVIKNLDNIKI